MQDIAQLGFSIDSSPAAAAATALDRMTTSAAAATAGAASLAERHRQYVQQLEQTISRQNALIDSMQRSGGAAQALQQRIPELSASMTAFDRAVQSAADAVDNRITSSLRQTAEQIKNIEASFGGVDLAGWTDKARQGFASLYGEAQRFYQLTGTAPQQMLRFQYVTERIGIDARETARAIEKLSAAMQAVSRDGLQIRETLARYGVVPQQDAAQTAISFSDAIMRARPSQQRTRDAMAVFGTNDPEVLNRISGFSTVRRSEDQAERSNRLRREADELESIRLRTQANQIREQAAEALRASRSARAPDIIDRIFSREGSDLNQRVLRLADRLSGSNAEVGGELDLIEAQRRARRLSNQATYDASGGDYGRLGRIASFSWFTRGVNDIAVDAVAGVDSLRSWFGAYERPRTTDEAAAENRRRNEEFQQRLRTYESQNAEFQRRAAESLAPPAMVMEPLSIMPLSGAPVRPGAPAAALPQIYTPEERRRKYSEDLIRWEREMEAFRLNPSDEFVTGDESAMTRLLGRTAMRRPAPRRPELEDYLLSAPRPEMSESERIEQAALLRDIARGAGISVPATALEAAAARRSLSAAILSRPADELGGAVGGEAADELLKQLAESLRMTVAEARVTVQQAALDIERRSTNPTGFARDRAAFNSTIYSLPVEARPLEAALRNYGEAALGSPMNAPRQGTAAYNDIRDRLRAENDDVLSQYRDRSDEVVRGEERIREAMRSGRAATEEMRVEVEALNEARRRGMSPEQQMGFVAEALRPIRARRASAIEAAEIETAASGIRLDNERFTIRGLTEVTPDTLATAQIDAQLRAEVDRRWRDERRLSNTSVVAGEMLPGALLGLTQRVAGAQAAASTAGEAIGAARSGDLNALQEVQAQLRANTETAREYAIAMKSGNEDAVAEVERLRAALASADVAAQRTAESMRGALNAQASSFRSDLNESLARLGPRERAIAQGALGTLPDAVSRMPEGEERGRAVDAWRTGRGFRSANGSVEFTPEMSGAAVRQAETGLNLSLVDVYGQMGAQSSAIQNAIGIMRRGGSLFEAQLAMSQSGYGITAGAANAAARTQLLGQAQISAFQNLAGQRASLAQADAIGALPVNATGLEQQLAALNATLAEMLRNAPPEARPVIRDASLAQGQIIIQSRINGLRAGRQAQSDSISDMEAEIGLGALASDRTVSRTLSARRIEREYGRSIQEADRAREIATTDEGRARADALASEAEQTRQAGMRGLDLSDQIQQMREYREAGASASRVIADGFRAAALEGRSFGDVVKYVGGSLAAIAGRVFLERPIERALTNFVGGGLSIPSISTGAGAAPRAAAGTPAIPGAAATPGASAPSAGGIDTMSLVRLRGLVSSNGSNLTTGIGPIDSGIASVNGFLQTPLFDRRSITGLFSSEPPPVFGADSVTDPTAFINNNSFTVGDAVSGLGYAYGAYSGFQRGGTGGTIQGVGNVAALAMLATPAAPLAPFVAMGSSLLGSAFGDDQGFKGGDALYQVGADGRLSLDRQVGKNFNENLGDGYAPQIRQFNKFLRNSDLRFNDWVKDLDYAVALGGGESDKPKSLQAALEGMGASFTSDNANVAKAIAGRTSFEEINEISQWITGIYEPMARSADGAATFAASIEALAKSFDKVIREAGDYGLQTETIFVAKQEALDKAYENRFRSVQDNDAALLARAAAAGGNQSEILRERRSAMEISASRQRADIDDFLRQNGVTGEWADGIRARLEATLAKEASAMSRQEEDLRYTQRETLSGLRIRRGAASANLTDWSGDDLGQSLWSFDAKAWQEIQTTQKSLQALGMTSAEVAEAINLLNQAHIDERAAIEKAYNERRRQISEGLDDRLYATQNDGSTLEERMAAFDRRAAKERVEAAKDGMTDLVQLERVLAAERAKVLSDEMKAVGGNIRQYIDQIRTNPRYAGTYSEQFTAAQEQFGRDLTLARGGDRDALGRITQSADTLLGAGRNMFASGLEFQALKEFVASSLENLQSTKSYDQLILEELQKLGGVVDVKVDLSVVRVVSEVLNALPVEDRNQLIQTQTVLRTVEERLGRKLTAAEQNELIQGAVVERSISQALGRDLTAAERAALLESDVIDRMIRQELAGDLTQAERDRLVQSDLVIRSIEQQMGRDLTDAEKADLIKSATVNRIVSQQLGADLTAEQRAGLLQAASVIRSIEQRIGTDLSLEDRARIFLPGGVTRTISQQAAAPTGAPVVTGGTVVRDVTQNIETTETVQISRSIDDKLSGLMTTIASNTTSLYDVTQNVVAWRLDRINDGIQQIVEAAVSGDAGLVVRTRDWTHNAPGWGNVRFATGGVVVGPTDLIFPDGTRGQMGEAGEEGIFPLERGSDGRLGIKAIMPKPPRQEAVDILPLLEEIRSLRQEVSALRAASGRDGRRTADAAERTAQATETMVTTKTSLRPQVPVGERIVA
ncbi:hypothetical protein [Falsiroseomonas sp. CW058]|uniref:hypothetical protein n=1 Tax=Falsiroseomonas sp. CW058 TaxID=3388664 RepID=UPI003D31A893